MIDFKNAGEIPRRITKHTVKEGDFFTKSMTALEKEKLLEKYKGKPENDFVVAIIKAVLCDEEGNLLNLTLKNLKSLPDVLFQDITKACLGIAAGEKKS